MIPGGTSTGSKRPAAMFGAHAGPAAMTRAEGCRVWDADGREYLDTTMALGAVALGYGHPAVADAVAAAARNGTVGPLPPVHEAALAEELLGWVDGAEAVRFLKTGAEAVSAAVRIARVVTGREAVVTCGYQGWLDWCQDAAGVPAAVRQLRHTVPFNEAGAVGPIVEDVRPAAIVLEPVVDSAPAAAWIAAVQDAARRHGALVILDEIKTGIRFGPGGAARRYGFRPHLTVLGKALGNGMPIAAVLGPADLMAAAERTWISSTLATEYTALAAALSVVQTARAEHLAAAVTGAGHRFHAGLTHLAAAHPRLVRAVSGVPEFCYLRFASDETGAAVAAGCARRGLLYKRTAYNFMALPHTDAIVDTVLDRLAAALDEAGADAD